MADRAVICRVRHRRAELGLSQAELARRVGVSRQALSAIETGRQAPSTPLALLLARSLRCTVDDLFRLASGPMVRATLAEPSAEPRVVLGRVDGALVAHGLQTAARAADGAVVSPPDADGGVGVELFTDPGALETTALVAGCAPLLGLLADRLGRRYRDAQARCIPAHSGRALDLLAAGSVHVAGIHLTGGASSGVADVDPHVHAVRGALPGRRAHLVNLARWQQGLVVAAGNPLGLEGPADLDRPGLRIAAREAGSGAQRLLESVSRGSRRSPPVCVAASHDEVADLVRFGVADVGVTIEAAAIARGLGFLPLCEERFDLVVPASQAGVAAVARLLELVDAPAFRAEAAGIPGYDLSIAGHASLVEQGVA